MAPEPPPHERQAGIRPFPSAWRTVDMAGRRILPVVSTAIVVLLLAFPLGLPGQPAIQSAYLMTSVYFWSIYRPGSMPPSAAFALGLLADLLGPQPPGVIMLVLVVLGGSATRLRVPLLRRGFLVLWLAFCGMAAVATLAEWTLFSLLDLRSMPPLPGLLAWGLAAGLYPLLAAALIRLHRGLAAPERA